MNISFEYPMWFVGLCVLLGVAYASFLYINEKTFQEEGGWKVLAPLALLRFLSATAIAILLLSPLLRQQFTDVQKPYVLLLQDNSASIPIETKTEDLENLRQNFKQIETALSEEYNVQQFTFGDDLKEGETLDYTAKTTNISGMMSDLYDRFSYQNVGAIVLASDGLFNAGSNPAYNDFQLDVPIYTVALGDTSAKKDVKINQVLHNKIAYAGDKTTVRVDVSAINAKGEKTTLNVYAGKGTGKRVTSKTIKIDKEKFFQSVEIILEPSGKGVKNFTISASPIEGEAIKENNTKTIYIDVLEGRQKITILAGSPHPDISALKQAIENGRNYEVTIKYADTFNGNTSGQDLFILHGLPSNRYEANKWVAQLKANKVPIWFIATTQTDWAALNNMQSVVSLAGNGTNATNDSKADTNPQFGLFTYESELAQNLESFPPLLSPFGEYVAAPNAQTLLKQKIGSVGTNYPLLSFLQSSNDYKTAVLCAEGIWKWRIYDYTKDKQFETVDELVSKTVQYLAVKNDKRQFRVNIADNLFNENESIKLNAELYNDSYELVNEPDASLTIADGDGQQYPFTFSKTANAYTLDAGVLPVGEYNFIGKTNWAGNSLQSSGSFTVKPLQLEALNTTANHQLLNTLSEKSGGELLYPNQVGDLLEKIKNREEIKPVLFSSYRTESAMNLRWLFFAILGLLTLEWFIRKFKGAY